MARNIDEILEYICETYYPEHEYNDMWRERNAELRFEAKQKILTDLLKMAEDSWTREQLYQSTEPGVTVNSIKAVPVEAIKQYFGGSE